MATFGLTRTTTTLEFDVTTDEPVPELKNGVGAFYARIRPTRAAVAFALDSGLPHVSRADATGISLTGPRLSPASGIGHATFDLTAPNGAMPDVVSELLDFIDEALQA